MALLTYSPWQDLSGWSFLADVCGFIRYLKTRNEGVQEADDPRVGIAPAVSPESAAVAQAEAK